jgi:hypothetical protein
MGKVVMRAGWISMGVPGGGASVIESPCGRPNGYYDVS